MATSSLWTKRNPTRLLSQIGDLPLLALAGPRADLSPELPPDLGKVRHLGRGTDYEALVVPEFIETFWVKVPTAASDAISIDR